MSQPGIWFTSDGRGEVAVAVAVEDVVEVAEAEPASARPMERRTTERNAIFDG